MIVSNEGDIGRRSQVPNDATSQRIVGRAFSALRSFYQVHDTSYLVTEGGFVVPIMCHKQVRSASYGSAFCYYYVPRSYLGMHGLIPFGHVHHLLLALKKSCGILGLHVHVSREVPAQVVCEQPVSTGIQCQLMGCCEENCLRFAAFVTMRSKYP